MWRGENTCMECSPHVMDFQQGDIGFAYVERMGLEGDPVPVLPEGVAAWYLASPNEKCSWALYGFRILDEDLVNRTALLLDVVSEEMAQLLDSAREYPPALALARDVLDHNFEEVPEKEEYTHLFCEELRHHLANLDNPFFLAEAQLDDGDLQRGAFYWVVGYEAAERKLLGVRRDGWVENFDPVVFGFTHEFLRWRFPQ